MRGVDEVAERDAARRGDRAQTDALGRLPRITNLDTSSKSTGALRSALPGLTSQATIAAVCPLGRERTCPDRYGTLTVIAEYSA